MTSPSARASKMARVAGKLRYSKVEAALLGELQRRCEGELEKGVLVAKHGEVEYRLRFLPKHQGYALSVGCRFAGRFRITRKSGLDRSMEGFVPALRFRSRDSRFDRDFNVHTRDLKAASAVLTQKPIRAAVRSLLGEHARTVRVPGDHVEVIVHHKALKSESAADDVLGQVEELAVIATAVTAYATRHGVRPSPRQDPALVLSWTTVGALGVLGFVMVLTGALQFTLVRPASFLLPCALFGLLAILPVALALTFAVRRRTSPYGLVRGLVGVSLVTAPLFVSGALLLSNGLFDESPADEHVVSVVGKSAKKSKNEWRYHAGLASWWTEGDVRWVRISKATYDRLEPHVSRMLIRTHPGTLGYEWIDDYIVVP